MTSIENSDLNKEITYIKTQYDLFSHHLTWTFFIQNEAESLQGALLLCRSVKRVLYFLERVNSQILSLEKHSLSVGKDFEHKENDDLMLSLGEQNYKYDIEAFLVFLNTLLCRKSAAKFFSSLPNEENEKMRNQFNSTFDSLEVWINHTRNDTVHLNEEFIDHNNYPTTFSYKTKNVQTGKLSERDGSNENLVLDFIKAAHLVLPILREAANTYMKHFISLTNAETNKLHTNTFEPYKAVGSYHEKDGFQIRVFKPEDNAVNME